MVRRRRLLLFFSFNEARCREVTVAISREESNDSFCFLHGIGGAHQMTSLMNIKNRGFIILFLFLENKNDII